MRSSCGHTISQALSDSFHCPVFLLFFLPLLLVSAVREMDNRANNLTGGHAQEHRNVAAFVLFDRRSQRPTARWRSAPALKPVVLLHGERRACDARAAPVALIWRGGTVLLVVLLPAESDCDTAASTSAAHRRRPPTTGALDHGVPGEYRELPTKL